MRAMPDQSVNCCVTSPPYFGLRDYGHAGQIGLEPTPDEFVAALVAVFREVRRVLRDDGTLWLNLGDSYANAGGKAQPHRNNSGGFGGSNGSRTQGYALAGGGFERPATVGNGVKVKDLIGIPWRVAFALQADGWYLRQDIIWHKPNPMPESVKDRCTKAHEYIFLLSKGPRYYFDHEAIKEPAREPNKFNGRRGRSTKKTGANGDRNDGGRGAIIGDGFRNRRSVWTVTTKPFKGAHFATFPPDLIEPCILAGCPEGGTVLDPFGGSGTTAGVALAHNRKAVLCELNADYAALIEGRIADIGSKIGRKPLAKAVAPDSEAEQPRNDLFQLSLT